MILRHRKRNLEATRDQWARAIDTWNLLRESTPQVSKQLINATKPQLGMYFATLENPKAMIGEPVLVIANIGGEPFNTYPYRATVVNVIKQNDEYMYKVLFHQIVREAWAGERLELVHLYQLEQVRNTFHPTAQQLASLRTVSVLDHINRARQGNTEKLKKEILQVQNTLTSYEREVESYRRKAKEMSLLLEKDQTPTLTETDLHKLLDQFGKNKKVFDAYLNEQGQMIVVTNPLYAIDNKTQQQTTNLIGTLVFLLDTRGASYCNVENLSRCYHQSGNPSHYGHPNVENRHICTGENGAIMDRMAKAAQFYELADFLLLFLSLFPHDAGGPYVSHDVWMQGAHTEAKANPWKKQNPIWSLKPQTKRGRPRKSIIDPLTPISFSSAIRIGDMEQYMRSSF